jgi:hypothetical protein
MTSDCVPFDPQKRHAKSLSCPRAEFDSKSDERPDPPDSHPSCQCDAEPFEADPITQPPGRPQSIGSLPPREHHVPRADRYGWRVQEDSALVVDERELQLRREDSAREFENETKWAKVLPAWQEFKSKHPEKLNRWIMGGIPDCLRLRV